MGLSGAFSVIQEEDRVEWKDGKCRCCWANPKNERYIRYHDEEWGRSVHDDRKLFEMLVLECFQAGLSWECILNKREPSNRHLMSLSWKLSAGMERRSFRN